MKVLSNISQIHGLGLKSCAKRLNPDFQNYLYWANFLLCVREGTRVCKDQRSVTTAFAKPGSCSHKTTPSQGFAFVAHPTRSRKENPTAPRSPGSLRILDPTDTFAKSKCLPSPTPTTWSLYHHRNRVDHFPSARRHHAIVVLPMQLWRITCPQPQSSYAIAGQTL